MSTIKDMAQLGRLIAARHGWPAAKAFKAYVMTDADRATLTTSALDLLALFPSSPDADYGAMLSGAFAVQLERALSASELTVPKRAVPVQLVSGGLSVAGQAVLGTDDTPDHVWVMVGPYVADIALFRLAYARSAPPALFHHIDRVFGPNKALYVDHWARNRHMGLTYEPRDVLAEADVTALMGDAYRAIQAGRGGD